MIINNHQSVRELNCEKEDVEQLQQIINEIKFAEKIKDKTIIISLILILFLLGITILYTPVAVYSLMTCVLILFIACFILSWEDSNIITNLRKLQRTKHYLQISEELK